MSFSPSPRGGLRGEGAGGRGNPSNSRTFALRQLKTFLVDLHGGLARLGPALPLLYPFQARGELEEVRAPEPCAAARGLGAMAEAVRISMLRDFRPGVQVVFLADLPVGPAGPGLVEQVERIRAEFLAPLAAGGLTPSRVVVVALDSLARERDTGVPLDPGARERWEKDADALAPPAGRVLEGVTALRFPLRRAPEVAFQQDLVRLVYLVAVLVELFGAGDEVGAGRLLSVDEVALDAPGIARWLAEYERCLRRGQTAVDHQLDHPEPVSIPLIEDAGCGCAGVLGTPRLAPKTFPLLRGLDDANDWRRWWQEAGQSLATHAQAAEELVRRCTREWRTREFRPTPREVADVAGKAEELGRRLEESRRALATGDRLREDGAEFDWDDDMRRMTPRVHALLDARPRLQATAVFSAVLLLLLLTPVWLTLPPSRPVAVRLETVALLLAGSAGVLYGTLSTLRGRLHAQANEAYGRAVEITSGVLNHAERRRRHLTALCEMEVARRNDAQAQAALRAARRRTLMLKHHRAALERHLELARAFARCHPAAPSAVPPSSRVEGDGAARAATREWPVDVPPHLSPVYAPALCAGARAEEAYEVRVGARVLRRASSLIVGLHHIRLGDDVIFRRPAGSQPGPPAPAGGTSP